MYNTSIRHNKCLVECIAVLDRVRVTKFIVDTGATFTYCNCKIFDSHNDENTLEKNEIKILGGFIKGLPVSFYKCNLKQFTIGSLNMGRQDRWVTFDKRVTDTVLGMDILKQVIMITNPYNQKIYFCKDAEDYEQNFQLKVRWNNN